MPDTAIARNCGRVLPRLFINRTINFQFLIDVLQSFNVNRMSLPIIDGDSFTLTGGSMVVTHYGQCDDIIFYCRHIVPEGSAVALTGY